MKWSQLWIQGAVEDASAGKQQPIINRVGPRHQGDVHAEDVRSTDAAWICGSSMLHIIA
jgi:hypothetical protein